MGLDFTFSHSTTDFLNILNTYITRYLHFTVVNKFSVPQLYGWIISFQYWITRYRIESLVFAFDSTFLIGQIVYLVLYIMFLVLYRKLYHWIIRLCIFITFLELENMFTVMRRNIFALDNECFSCALSIVIYNIPRYGIIFASLIHYLKYYQY